MKKYFFVFFLFSFQNVFSQFLYQTLRGTVKDLDGQFGLVGATVSVKYKDQIKSTVAEIDGKFKFEKTPLGRVDLKISFVGYEDKLMSNIELTSGKEVVLDIALQESLLLMGEVVVKANKVKGEVENDMALVSARQVTVDETQRYAGSFNDPARMVSSFAGVTGNMEGSNDIVVRGNSPKFIQWKLEGVEMPNPNHFGDLGGTGGPISALNSNLLATSDFYTGAFAPEYGNVLSGVFDVKFRKGNNEKREYSFGIGALGIDASMEGPFKKGSGASYLFNYRYSSLALLDNLGLVDFGGVPKYQDAAFKIVLPSKKLGSFTFFGMGGLSNISEKTLDTLDSPLINGNIYQHVREEDFQLNNNLFITGLNHLCSISNNFFVQSGVSFAGWGNKEIANETKNGKVFLGTGKFLKDSLLQRHESFNADFDNLNFSTFVKLNYKVNNKHKLEAGFKYINTAYAFKNQEYRPEKYGLVSDLDLNKSVDMFRNFSSWKYRINENLTTVVGFQNVYLPLTEENSFEPRLSLRYQKPGKGALSFAYGKHSTMDHVANYFVKVEDKNGLFTQPNKNLALLKADHIVLGYEKRIGANHIAKVETYYQNLYDLPVENDAKSYYSTINEISGFKNVALVSEGKGKNYGIELTMERFFSQNYYYLITASIYQSKYIAKDGIERNTIYNNNYAFNFLIGKEFVNFGKKQNKTFGINAKLLYVGARKIIPLLRNDNGELAVNPAKNLYYDYSKAYEKGLDNVFQINASASLKINKARLTHEIAVDVINANNTTARIDEYYNPKEKDKIGYYTPMSLIPNLVYRVKF
jgi:hypothetical protein